MEITAVKYTADGGYLVNGMHVPNAVGNRHYKMVQEWILEGGVVEPFETAAEIVIREDREHNATIVAELAELDKQSIRDIREWVASQPSAPQGLKDRETAAVLARGKLK